MDDNINYELYGLADNTEELPDDANASETPLSRAEEMREQAFSRAVVALMKNAISRDTDATLWATLTSQRFAISDYVNRIGLTLIIDEVDGYAFLKQRDYLDGSDEIPRIIPRHQLSYPVSLLLVLLRKRLLEHDASVGDGRLILTREQILELMQVFYKDVTNETKTIKSIDRTIEQVKEMGFLRKLSGSNDTYEVQRILRSFINADWMNKADATLDAYLRFELGDNYNEESAQGHEIEGQDPHATV